jgi:RimJ/RimL family protein N-acetyltransferase
MLNPFLIGEKIYLRAPEPGDEKIIALSENHPEARAYLYYALPTNIEHHKRLLEKRQDDHNAIWLTIATIEPDVPIGTTALVRIDWVGRMATFYIAIAESKNWSHGYGKEATRLVVDYAFGTLNFNRIQLHVSVENQRAIKAYEKVGFKIEGTLRQAMYFANRYHDFYLMAILKEDWLKDQT